MNKPTRQNLLPRKLVLRRASLRALDAADLAGVAAANSISQVGNKGCHPEVFSANMDDC